MASKGSIILGALKTYLGIQVRRRAERCAPVRPTERPRAAATSAARLRARRSSPAVRGCRSRPSASRALRARPGSIGGRFARPEPQELRRRLQVALGERVQAQNRAGDGGFLRGAARLRVWRGGSLGLVHFGWRFAGGHSMRWSPMRRTRIPGRLRIRVLSVYSLISGKVRAQERRPVQWSLLN